VAACRGHEARRAEVTPRRRVRPRSSRPQSLRCRRRTLPAGPLLRRRVEPRRIAVIVHTARS
jgi:hypothetical protein